MYDVGLTGRFRDAQIACSSTRRAGVANRVAQERDGLQARVVVDVAAEDIGRE
jgi:hypothetical protein